MAVRISEDNSAFWQNYNTHKDLIERCFHYLLTHRFPNPEGAQDSYGTVLQRLHELNVFNRFDLKRIIAQRMGVDKKYMYQITEEDCNEVVVQALGINVEKKFEQFMFKWIEHILEEAYSKRRKHADRYITSRDIAEQPPCNSKELREILGESSFAQSEKETANLEKHLDKKARIDNMKVSPTYADRECYVGTKHEDALDTLVVEDLKAKVRAQLRDKERTILDMTLEGVPGSDIAVSMKCSPQHVNSLMQRIRERFVECMREERVTA
jgi:DNA-directed RNA polymerase specialized sigma24 family protein